MLSFIQNKHVTLTLLVFLVAILTARDFIIVHDETLVLLCFILFLTFLYVALKDMVTASFNDRALQIEKEFNDSYSLKEQTLQLLANHHEKQVSLLNEIDSLMLFTKSEVNNIIQTRQAALRARLISEFRTKLNTAVKKEDAFFQFIQQTTNTIVMNSILENISGPTGEALKNTSFEEGIRILEEGAISLQDKEEANS
uniref:ATP synthase subunit b n=1 Tax=Reclinomonas americana TaxID=48483 RepID=O21290_RECAM|nr:ATP synthase subunit b [Reclinomonas americana]AAD11920.1 ATP synthase subunit b [Reclinomonas americana]